MRLLLCTLVCAALLGGCGFGGPAPMERYLRLEPVSGGGCSGEASEAEHLVLTMKRLEVLPGLDRTAVMLARGGVLTPSTVWYWEGAPGEMVGEALAGAVDCTRGVRMAWPYHPRIAHAALVEGRVLAFEVHTGSRPRALVRVELELLGPHGGAWLAGETFEGEAELSSLTPEAVAGAMGQALGGVVEQGAAWLASKAPGLGG